MLKIACFLTGDNYKLVSVDTPSSKKKIVAMALAMIVPVLIWVFNGFMLSNKVLQAPIYWAIMIGFVCGAVVFVVEKLVIMAKGNGWLTFFRICIGLFVALLGSIAIDEVIFKDDIGLGMKSIKSKIVEEKKSEEDSLFKISHSYTALEKQINAAQEKYDDAVAATSDEADGGKGTKTKGIGPVTKLKGQIAKDRKMDLSTLQMFKANLDLKKDSVINKAGFEAAQSFNEHALLTRIKALFQLVIKDDYMLGVYIVFTLLLFFFEFLVVILKCTWSKTNYENKLEMIEDIGRQRMEFLKKKDSPVNDPGYYLPQLEQARAAITKGQSIYN